MCLSGKGAFISAACRMERAREGRASSMSMAFPHRTRASRTG
jgi:hypothetical protein